MSDIWSKDNEQKEAEQTSSRLSSWLGFVWSSFSIFICDGRFCFSLMVVMARCKGHKTGGEGGDI